jgi:hypothetical protein
VKRTASATGHHPESALYRDSAAPECITGKILDSLHFLSIDMLPQTSHLLQKFLSKTI